MYLINTHFKQLLYYVKLNKKINAIDDASLNRVKTFELFFDLIYVIINNIIID